MKNFLSAVNGFLRAFSGNFLFKCIFARFFWRHVGASYIESSAKETNTNNSNQTHNQENATKNLLLMLMELKLVSARRS